MAPTKLAMQPTVLVSGAGGEGDMDWATAVEAWAEWMRSEGIRKRTIELRRYQISHLGDEILRRNPWKVKSDDLVRWLAQQNWAPETRRSYRSAINGFYVWAIRTGHTKRNPAAELRSPRMTRALPRPAPDDVLDRALAKANDADRVMLLLAAYQGLRRTEIATFRLDLLDDDVIYLRGKGGKIRVVPVHKRVAEELADERDRRVAGRRGTGYRYATGAINGWLFPGRSGHHMTPNAVGKRISALLGPGWSGHTLRHRFLTQVLTRTGNLAVAQELAGHASPATTRIYARVSVGALRDAINTI